MASTQELLEFWGRQDTQANETTVVIESPRTTHGMSTDDWDSRHSYVYKNDKDGSFEFEGKQYRQLQVKTEVCIITKKKRRIGVAEPTDLQASGVERSEP